MSDISEREITKYRSVKPWTHTIEIPLEIPDRDATVRSATRPVDEQIGKPDPKFGMAVIGMCLIFAVLFLALCFGVFDFAYPALKKLGFI